jgi:hypothetical protein
MGRARLILLVSTVATACAPKSSLPTARPTDLKLSYRTCGMRPCEELVCDGKTLQCQLGGDQKSVTHAITPKQLDDLYEVFRAQEFDTLTTRTVARAGKDFVDGESFALSLTLGDRTYRVEGGTGKETNSPSRLNAVVDAVSALQQKLLVEQLPPKSP